MGNHEIWIKNIQNMTTIELIIAVRYIDELTDDVTFNNTPFIDDALEWQELLYRECVNRLCAYVM